MSQEKLKPGEHLVGLTLNNRWKVLERLERQPGHSGGNFSVPYHAEEIATGKKVFVKAIDITDRMLMKGPDVALRLNILTNMYLYEKSLLDICKPLSRIVTAIDDGTIQAGTIDGAHPYPVFFLIFDRASGDARSQVNKATQFPLSKSIRSLHHVAVGIRQLHHRDIAHQDLKPSNILFFPEQQGFLGSKIADVGRALRRGVQSPYDGEICLGDPSYAPPELLYNAIASDWIVCRLGADLYLFGSLIVSYLVGLSITSLIDHFISNEHHHDNWTGSYEEVLLYVRSAFEEAMSTLISPSIYQRMAPTGSSEAHRRAAGEVVAAVRYLCDPDPSLRGHPSDRKSNQYSLERVISRLDVLAKSAELGQI